MINEIDKNLVAEFFKKVNLFLELFNNAPEKWKVLPECNDYINDLYDIAKRISSEDENFENIILDLESMVAMQRNDDSLFERYREFIASVSQN